MDVAERVSGMAARLSEMSDIMECQYGLLSELKARKVLTSRQISDIEETSNPFKQCDKLISLVARILTRDERMHERFLQSLRETGQSHVANHIMGGEFYQLSFKARLCTTLCNCAASVSNQ